MTFFGEPRGDHHTHDHAHESPNTMLIPLGVLAVGSVLAGMVWYGVFFGDHDEDERLVRHARRTRRPRRSSRRRPTSRRRRGGARRGRRRRDACEAAPAAEPTHEGAPAEAQRRRTHAAGRSARCSSGRRTRRSSDAHHAPAWVKASPFVAMLIGRAGRLLVLHRQPVAAGGAGAEPAGALPLPAQQVVLRRDLRLRVRAAGEVARHAALEGRRRRRRSTAR